MTTEQKSSLRKFQDVAIGLYGFGFLAFGLYRYFRVSNPLDGPLGVLLVVVVAAGLFVLMFFVMGWAFRKGWRTADSD